MTHHSHLLMSPERADTIPRLIIVLGQRYVQYINTTYRRTGTWWDSRYESSLIQAETCLLSSQRYIELNPVRAARVNDSAPYRESSCRHPAPGQSNPYLTPHPLYLAIGRDDSERRAAYRDLFRAQLDSNTIDDIRLALNQNQQLGNARFYAEIETSTGQRREAKPRGRPRKPPDDSAAHDAEQGELGV